MDQLEGESSMKLHELVLQTGSNPEINQLIQEYLVQNPNELEELQLMESEREDENALILSPLQVSSRYSGSKSSERTVEVLLKAGAKVDVQV